MLVFMKKWMKETELIDRFLEINEKETQIVDHLGPLGDFLEEQAARNGSGFQFLFLRIC